MLAPVVGGLLYGPLIHCFAREARGHGVPEVMARRHRARRPHPPQVAVVKSLASALCIGSGGSVGREGPIVQIGSALGSTLGQVTRVPESRLRILVACGAAGGISATFNAPIAGVFFALELILRDFEAESFGVVVLSSFVADIIGRAAFGIAPVPRPARRSAALAARVSALRRARASLAALVGIAFIRVLYGARGPRRPDLARAGVAPARRRRRPARAPAARAAASCTGSATRRSSTRSAGGYGVWLLLLLLAGKIVATSLTIAIGGSGGVFAPSLFMGAMLGTRLRQRAAPPASGLDRAGRRLRAGRHGGGVRRRRARADHCGDHHLRADRRLPDHPAADVRDRARHRASSSLLSRDTIYTLKLRRRGIDVLRGRGANLMQVLSVADAMQPPPAPLAPGTPLNETVARLMQAPTDGLPVVDDDGCYRGTVSSRQLEQAIRDNVLDAMRGRPCSGGAGAANGGKPRGGARCAAARALRATGPRRRNRPSTRLARPPRRPARLQPASRAGHPAGGAASPKRSSVA